VHAQLLLLFGTAAIAAAVIGSGELPSGLTSDLAVAPPVNQMSTVLMLGLVIWLFMPISGAHFNPVVSLIMRFRGSLGSSETLLYVLAQTIGAVGVALANLMFAAPVISMSHTSRASFGRLVGEILATAGAVFTHSALAVDRSNAHLIPVLVPTWIGTALFFTSSTAFANPAVTLGRAFSDPLRHCSRIGCTICCSPNASDTCRCGGLSQTVRTNAGGSTCHQSTLNLANIQSIGAVPRGTQRRSSPQMAADRHLAGDRVRVLSGEAYRNPGYG
jgi:glycerol uptake facilitator-like aquaporin